MRNSVLGLASCKQVLRVYQSTVRDPSIKLNAVYHLSLRLCLISITHFFCCVVWRPVFNRVMRWQF